MQDSLLPFYFPFVFTGIELLTRSNQDRERKEEKQCVGKATNTDVIEVHIRVE